MTKKDGAGIKRVDASVILSPSFCPLSTVTTVTTQLSLFRFSAQGPMYVIRPVRSHPPLALAAVRSPTNVNWQRPFHHHHHYDQHRYTTTTAIATTRAQSSPTKPPVQAKTFSRRFHDIAARSARSSKPAEPSPLPPASSAPSSAPASSPKVVAQSPHERRNLQPPTSPQTVPCAGRHLAANHHTSLHLLPSRRSRSQQNHCQSRLGIS